ncbi:hypothetical protein B9Z55_017897 [Caenorhabditis nigoni]|nr:hypothetical protein B9Z55_017897 [Caenorhabditis nigoni]
MNLKTSIREKNANVPLFSAITLSHIMCLLFFIADFLYLRLPLSGLLTSWCARLQPSGYLLILIIIVYHINYIVVILPFLVAVIRLMLILSPQTHHKINSKILKCAFPLILLSPFFFTYGMFSTVGYCEYPGWPVEFGGVIFRVKYNGVGIQNKYGLLFNTVFWLLASLAINTLLILKLVILKSIVIPHTVSRASQRAQLSLTITSVSMTLACVTNGLIACLLFFLADFLYLRLPLSGLLTSWCARLQPSGYLVILIIIVYHINYIVVILPFLVAVIRLISILSPQRHHKIRNALGLIFNTFFWLLACLVINIVLIVKLVKLKHALGQHAKSQASHKAEISLTITSVAMAFAYVTNGMIANLQKPYMCGADGQEAILKFHNELRSTVANGTYNVIGTIKPPAASTRKMKWDESLAASPQKHAEKCIHDYGAPPKLGENTFTFLSHSAPTNLDQYGARASYTWEQDFQNQGWNSTSTGENPIKSPIRRAVPLVYAETDKIGCGVFNRGNNPSLPENDMNNFYMIDVVCYYEKAVSNTTSDIYMPGDACSSCSEGLICETSSGLCV